MATVRSSFALVPAAARPTEPAVARRTITNTDLYAFEAAKQAISTFEQALGGREALIAELLLAPEISDDVRELVALACDPAYDGRSLGELCGEANLSPGAVFSAFRDLRLAKATIQATKLATDAIVPVLTQIISTALPSEAPCRKCKGTGQLTVKGAAGKPDKSKACTKCDGRGTVVVPPSADAQQLVLQLAGVIGSKDSGPAVAVNVQQNNVGSGATPSAAGGGVAQLQQAVSGILFGAPMRGRTGGPIVDAEPADPADPPDPPDPLVPIIDPLPPPSTAS